MNSPATDRTPTLRVFFIPFSAVSHLIPLVDTTRLFASTGTVHATIITTPYNALLFQNSINQDIKLYAHQISIHKLAFPAAEVGLPTGIENYNAITSPEMSPKLYTALSMLQPQIEQFCRENPPNCIVSDILFPWTVQLAAELGIPRLLFSPTGFFPLSVMDSLERYKPHENVRSDAESFVLPGLPDHLEMTRSQLPEHYKKKTFFGEVMEGVLGSIQGSYGVVMNSFYELEPAYMEYYRKSVKAKAWAVGPVFLCNRNDNNDCNSSAIKDEFKFNCFVSNWLDTKEPNSVIYICFGSTIFFSGEQLVEIAMGLEASDCSFIWVVRKQEDDDEEEISWLPEGFEEKMMMKKKGLIVRKWAPQRLILEHPATGGFLTHAGWNSVLETLSAGVPMITWPLFAEQVFNEKMVSEVLKIGVEVGIDEMGESLDQSLKVEKVMLKREKIEKAVRMLMSGGEAEEIRKRVRELGELGKRAVGEGGSSHSNLISLIEELKLCARNRQALRA